MKNDSFFNWLLISIALIISIGMLSKSLDYWWVPYLVSLVALARYTDFLESKEKEKEVVPFPTKKWSDPILKETYDATVIAEMSGHDITNQWAKVKKDALELELKINIH